MFTLNKIIIILFFITLSCYPQKEIEKKDFCNEINVVVKLKNWKNDKAKKVYAESGQWDEYDENGSTNPIPESIDIILDIDLKAYIMKHASLFGDLKIDDFAVSGEVVLKMGESEDCINVLNPKVFQPINLGVKKEILYSDFFLKNKYKTVTIKIPFKLRQELESIQKENSELKLVQIIVNVSLVSKSNSECKIEYNKAICKYL